MTFSKFVLVVLEHNLTVSVWMGKGNHLKSMHLLEELGHVGASNG